MAKIKKETVETLKRNPIYTTDMSKVKSYQDSLYAYDLNQKHKDLSDKKAKYLLGKIKLSEDDERIFLKSVNDFKNKYMDSGGVYDKKVKPYYVKDKKGDEVYDWIYYDNDQKLGIPRVNKPVQPYVYGFEKQELNPILKKTDFESEELSPIELKNKKISLKEPEHFLDISNPNGKGTQRIYFDTREELEDYQKENSMLKTGSFSRAKIDPKVLEVLKKKK